MVDQIVCISDLLLSVSVFLTGSDSCHIYRKGSWSLRWQSYLSDVTKQQSELPGTQRWGVEGRLRWLSGSHSAISIRSSANFRGEGRTHCAQWFGEGELEERSNCVCVCACVCLSTGLASRSESPPVAMFYSVSCCRHACHSLSEPAHSNSFKGYCRLCIHHQLLH